MSSEFHDVRLGPRDQYTDDEEEDRPEPVVYEGPVEGACVRLAGQAVCVFVGVLFFAALLAEIAVPGVTDMPSYANNLLYASVAHRFTDVHERIYAASPPPPPAF